MTTIPQRLEALRALMREHGFAAYIVAGTDPHNSEYMADHWKSTVWISGFKGEAATILVTSDRAFLWTDSRYYLQAGIELVGTTVELMRESDITTPTIAQWLCDNLKAGESVGVDAEMFTINAYNSLCDELSRSSLTLKNADLISPLWTEGRPAIPATPTYEYKVEYAGETTMNKLHRVREIMIKNKAQAMVISALDEIAWLLNIRALDVDYNPVVISYVLLETDKCTLFINKHKLSEAVCKYLTNNHISLKDYSEIFASLAALPADYSMMLDGARVNRALYDALPAACKKINIQSPVLVFKSLKNDIEIEGERTAMKRDAVALTRFFKWLEEEAFAEGIRPTEYELSEKLHFFRAEQKNFVVESFCTIAGYKGNGAIVHYEPTAEGSAVVAPEGMLLLDSGGQYLEGTTDITRTVWLGGDIPEQAKLDYTYVLKGHIALADIRWPKGTRGNQLDALAKQYMWQAGITYGHGTGHGVGHFLGCHEGPQNVRTDMNPTVLKEGNICSDEPGIYRTDKWGVRIENLVVVKPVEKTAAATTDDSFLCWETLTLCYYDTQLIEMSLLSEHEREWINNYHQRVFNEISPLLSPEEADWLRHKTAKI